MGIDSLYWREVGHFAGSSKHFIGRVRGELSPRGMDCLVCLPWYRRHGSCHFSTSPGLPKI